MRNDRTEAETHARLKHICPDTSPCRTDRPGPEGKVKGPKSTASKEAARASTADLLEAFLPAEPARRADGKREQFLSAAATTPVVRALRHLQAELPEPEPDEVGEDSDIAYVEEGGDNPFLVYDRRGQRCKRCGQSITSFTQGGRTTYWCPGCQA